MKYETRALEPLNSIAVAGVLFWLKHESITSRISIEPTSDVLEYKENHGYKPFDVVANQ